MSLRYRLRRALDHATHAGFPWPMGGDDGYSPALRRALRRSVNGLWPPGTRLAGQVLMTLLWPLSSLRLAVIFSFRIHPAARAGRNRLSIAARAWAAALRWNLPPLDYVFYRLFEPGRPGPGHWLTSVDAPIHFSAIADPAVREIAWDKLAFDRFAKAAGGAVVPVLAASDPSGLEMAFPEGKPPPVDLIVKPRRGYGGRGHTVWRWDGTRHSAGANGVDGDFAAWFERAARSGDLIVQALAQPPARIGPAEPLEAPLVSVLTAEGPDRSRAAAFAIVSFRYLRDGQEQVLWREVDPGSGLVQPESPGQVLPIWTPAAASPEIARFSIPDWSAILAAVDRLHAALPGPGPVLKWDVLLTCDGPRILEVNTGTGALGPQAMTLRPLMETPLGAVLEAWAR